MSFFVDIPYNKLSPETFRKEYLLTERPAIFRNTTSSATNQEQDDNNAFSRCIPLFGSIDKIKEVAIKQYDLSNGCPEVTSNAFMSCNRKHYSDVPVKSVGDALHLLEKCRNDNDVQPQQDESNDSESSVSSISYYMKLPLVSSPKILNQLKLEQFLISSSTSTSWVEHPMLLKPGGCFGWLFAGQKGSSSPSHVDIMGSDAFLACFSGLKEWAMVHPYDKHLIMNQEEQEGIKGGTEMADLFNIDYNKFPNARYARIHYFEQKPGDVVFVPGNAPHAVRNLEDSISITFNFLDKSTGGIKASQFLAYSMQHKTEKSTKLPASFVFRIFSPTKRIDFKLRATEFGVDWQLPSDEWTMRTSAGLEQLQEAAKTLRKIIPRKLLCLRAIGATVCNWEHSADFFFECDSEEIMKELATYFNCSEIEETSTFGCRWPLQEYETITWNSSSEEEKGENSATSASAAASASASSKNINNKRGFILRKGNVTPQILFPTLDSHFGTFSCFPPLCSILGYEWNFDKSLTETQPLMVEMRRSLAENFGQPLMWHYARFPIVLPRKSSSKNNKKEEEQHNFNNWCKTQLFYSSASLEGPISLYPLLKDNTLLPRAPMNDNNNSSHNSKKEEEEKEEETQNNKLLLQKIDQDRKNFYPHFVQLTWNIDNLMKDVSNGNLCATPIHLYEFGAVLQQRLISNLYMNLELFEDLAAAAKNLGLEEFPDDAKKCVDCGMEKILSLVMHLSSIPGLVGFRYSHVFSAVREPNTLCLIGGAASYLLTPKVAFPDISSLIAAQTKEQQQKQQEQKEQESSSDLPMIILQMCRFVKGPISKKEFELNQNKVSDEEGDVLAKDCSELLATFFFGQEVLLLKEESEEKRTKMKQITIQLLQKVISALEADIELQMEKIVSASSSSEKKKDDDENEENSEEEKVMRDIKHQHIRCGMLKVALEMF